MQDLSVNEGCPTLPDSEGKIRTIRTPGGQRRFCVEEYEPEDNKQIILYARVSTASQKDDLKRQVNYLQSIYPKGELVTEIGSGLNFKRRKFLSILERILKNDISIQVIGYSDRLVRFGFPLIEWLCQKTECKLVVR